MRQTYSHRYFIFSNSRSFTYETPTRPYHCPPPPITAKGGYVLSIRYRLTLCDLMCLSPDAGTTLGAEGGDDESLCGSRANILVRSGYIRRFDIVVCLWTGVLEGGNRKGRSHMHTGSNYSHPGLFYTLSDD